MSLYGLLLQVLPPRAAGVAFAIIYAALLVAILLLLPLPPADFHYGRY